MEYCQLYNQLKEAFDKGEEVELPDLGIRISHVPFFSEGAKYYLPGSEHLSCQDTLDPLLF